MQTPERNEFVLAALALGDATSYQPVHVQKLFFLLDKRVSKELDGAYFDFKAYDYGPFDSQVYLTLEELEDDEQVIIARSAGVRTYTLTAAGRARGNRVAEALTETVREEITKLAKWVVSQGFASLVSAIYRDYPKMKVNSVFLS